CRGGTGLATSQRQTILSSPPSATFCWEKPRALPPGRRVGSTHSTFARGPSSPAAVRASAGPCDSTVTTSSRSVPPSPPAGRDAPVAGDRLGDDLRGGQQGGHVAGGGLLDRLARLPPGDQERRRQPDDVLLPRRDVDQHAAERLADALVDGVAEVVVGRLRGE